MKYIDITKVNKAIDKIPENLKPRFFKKPQAVNKNRVVLSYSTDKNKKIPQPCVQIIKDLRLLDESDFENRALMTIGYLRMKDYTFNTALRYFTAIRSLGIFGEKCTVTPHIGQFEGRIQMRLITDHDYKLLNDYLLEHISYDTLPLILTIFTGLRAMEILQFTNLTLYELHTQQRHVSIRRKQTYKYDRITKDTKAEQKSDFMINWQPVYTTQISQFVKLLCEVFYKNEFELYLKNKIITKLFYCTTQTLTYRMKTYYIKATGQAPPLGFGLHICRSMSALLLANSTNNIKTMQYFLQHKNPKVTEVYLKRDARHISEDFNKYTQDSFDIFTNVLDAGITKKDTKDQKSTLEMSKKRHRDTLTEQLKSKKKATEQLYRKPTKQPTNDRIN